jgi:predicted adenylyl cyclase CyaB
MGTNIEIKAKAGDPAHLRCILEELCTAPAEAIPQEDIFFQTGNGRLKLRILRADYGELIYYERDNVTGPKRSSYLITPCADPASLTVLLSAALGTRGVVRKHRQLYRIGNTRVHLDHIDGLGCFVELEVVLNESQTSEEGQSIAEEIMKRLGICEADLVGEAYIDLMERKATTACDDDG